MVVLGLKTIHNAVLSASLIETFEGKDNHEEFDIRDFWHHSIAVAATSKHLGEKTLLEVPDERFVAGLLHDREGGSRAVLQGTVQPDFGPNRR